jgi:hypothetical protein
MAAPTRDHIRPRSKGGTLEDGNKALACHRCNTDKGSRSLASRLYRLACAGDPRAAHSGQFSKHAPAAFPESWERGWGGNSRLTARAHLRL